MKAKSKTIYSSAVSGDEKMEATCLGDEGIYNHDYILYYVRKSHKLPAHESEYYF